MTLDETRVVIASIVALAALVASVVIVAEIIRETRRKRQAAARAQPPRPPANAPMAPVTRAAGSQRPDVRRRQPLPPPVTGRSDELVARAATLTGPRPWAGSTTTEALARRTADFEVVATANQVLAAALEDRNAELARLQTALRELQHREAADRPVMRAGPLCEPMVVAYRYDDVDELLAELGVGPDRSHVAAGTAPAA